MSLPSNHDYIRFQMDNKTPDSPNPTISNTPVSGLSLNLKATELRLGLPGSQSPDRDNNIVNPTELCIGFTKTGAKRGFSVAAGNWVFSRSDTNKVIPEQGNKTAKDGQPPPQPSPVDAPKPAKKNSEASAAPASKAQVVGWPPIRSFRKNTMASSQTTAKNNNSSDEEGGVDGDHVPGQLGESSSSSGCLYVKVSMDGAPYLRKVDLNTYGGYQNLSLALEKMFSCFTIGQCGSHGRDGVSESRLVDILHGSEYVLTYEDKDGDWMLVGDVPWKMFIDSCRRLRIMKSSDAIGLAPRAFQKCKSTN
ncbi:Auxin-responsive protein IAA27 [Linum grandiflorum]